MLEGFPKPCVGGCRASEVAASFAGLPSQSKAARAADEVGLRRRVLLARDSCRRRQWLRVVARFAEIGRHTIGAVSALNNGSR